MREFCENDVFSYSKRSRFSKEKSLENVVFSRLFWRRMGDSNPRARKGKRFSRLLNNFPNRPEESLNLPNFQPSLAFSSHLPGNLRENCEKDARNR